MPGTKRALEDDEETADAEVAAAIAAAKAAPADEEIGGLGGGTAVIHFDVKPQGKRPKQYAFEEKHGEKSLVFLYLAIRGLGETQRLMLAEAGAEYTHFASPMGEDQSLCCEWRKRSPNGLTPVLSGLGVPRSSPMSQSASTIRFLAIRYGMAGTTEMDKLRVDNLFETVKDLGGKKGEITGQSETVTSGAKGPTLTAVNIERMLADMPDPSDDNAALNYGQMELLNLLLACEEISAGCVTKLSPYLDAFRVKAASRPRIAAYLASPMRFPPINADRGKLDSPYAYSGGPVKRSVFAAS